MKKLSCHCGSVEAEVNVPEKFEKVIKCNCSICKRKGFVMTFVGPDDLKITKGKENLKLYQFHTNTAKHYFCSKCGIHTHARPRSNPKIHMINIACLEGIDPFSFDNVSVNDGNNHPLDQKK
tara:strand:- start:216 stop:581 length:366 start_codon:yes stop_codon:yes gene_type:complete